MLRVDLPANVALELYREDVISRNELRSLFGIPAEAKPTPTRVWRVGDKVEGSEAYASLPNGTKVGHLTRVGDKFEDVNGVRFSPVNLFNPRHITALPA